MSMLFKRSEPAGGGLVRQAREIRALAACGLADINFEYDQFAPAFKSSLAAEAARLAREAGVCEKTAFLALMRLFEG